MPRPRGGERMIDYDLVGLLYTRTCPLACRHCLTESSPRARGKMRYEEARKHLVGIAAHCRSVSFTGGEPLLYASEIADLVRAASALGLRTNVVTGAGWIHAARSVPAVVRRLADAGLKRMTISWDEFHAEQTPVENALELARAAKSESIEVRLNVAVAKEAEATRLAADLAPLGVEVTALPLLRLGSAVELPPHRFQRLVTPPAGACRVVLKPLVDVDGTVYACSGPSLHSRRPSPLVLGDANAEPLADVLERARHDPLLEAISLVGPGGLYRLLEEDAPPARDAYFGVCELCLQITDLPEVVAALRRRLSRAEAKRLLTAARLWRDGRRADAGHP